MGVGSSRAGYLVGVAKIGSTPSGERLLASILADSDDAILSHAPDGTILSWNGGAERLYGYTSAEAIGHKISLLIPPDRQDEEDVLLEELARGERIEHFETQHLTKSGAVLDVSINMSPAYAEDGSILGASVTARDLTSAKRTDKDLFRTEQRFQAMFERSGHGIAITTIDGQLIEVNGAMAEILGYDTPQEVYAAKIHAPSLYKNPDVSNELFESMKASALLANVETEIRRRDGTFAWVSMNTVPILDSAGTVSGLQTMVTDISLKRSLEQQLYHAQKMEAVGRLTGGVAHDFNNLLSVILSYVDFALETVDGEVHDDLQEVRHAADRAAALVRQLLTFSRRDVIVPQVLDLNKRIGTTQRILERALGADIELEVDFQEDLWHVELDPTHAEQILLNLAVNAQDAMPSGGKLSIHTENRYIDAAVIEQDLELSPGNYVCVTISDTGTGMTPETIAHLFEPFYTTKSKEVGTGLGLATVYGIVSNARGGIHVYSEQGIGSTFRIFIPATDAPLPEMTQERESAAPVGTESVLIVDDEPSLTRIGGRVLDRAGYQVQTANSALEALRIAQTQDIDLLVTDVVMPGLSGTDLALRIRGAHPEARVLLMSGYSEDLLAHRGFFSAEHRLLTKPFSASQLLRAVRATLDEKDDPAAARWQIRTPTVVIMDEDKPVRALIRSRLEEAGYTVLGTYGDSGDGIEAVRRLRPQFVVLDVMLPGVSIDLVAATLRSEHPDMRIVAVARASSQRPGWADGFLPVSRLDELKELMSSLDLVLRPR